MEDEVAISDSAERRLLPWFDSFEQLEAWVIDQLLWAADEMRLHTQPPPGWNDVQPKRKRRESLRYIETAGGDGPAAVLLFDVVPEPETVTLRAAWPRCVKVSVTRHAQERMHERIDQLEPDHDRRRAWLNATVDRALRADSLTIEAPRWAASAPLKPGLGWTTRMLAGDEIALLVAAPHYAGGSWNIVTVLTKSTAISPLGRLVRHWKRTTRLLSNRLKYRTAEPVRAQALRPPRLGDLSAPPPRRFRRHRG